jgi:hypothetical protein
MLSIMIAAALLAADGPPTAARAPVAKAKANPDTIICKSEKVVGSKIPQRICMPSWQWEERRVDDSEMLSKGQRNQPKVF